MNEWMNKWMSEWMNEWMNEWTNGPKNRGPCICTDWTSINICVIVSKFTTPQRRQWLLFRFIAHLVAMLTVHQGTVIGDMDEEAVIFHAQGG